MFPSVPSYLSHMNITDKKIGVWGIGVVGKSVLSYLSTHGTQHALYAYDDAPCTLTQKQWLLERNITLVSERTDFFTKIDILIPSPGVPITKYTIPVPCYAEIDLFYDMFCEQKQKPCIIGITGTVGKTSITTLLTQLLTAAGYRAIALGNIGVGLLDFFSLAASYDYVVIELSSFQLEYCERFTPDLAIWTTFDDNHIDRHGTREQYAWAKYQLIRRVTKYPSIVPEEAIPFLAAFDAQVGGKRSYEVWTALRNQPLDLPHCSYKDNWRILFVVLRTLGISSSELFARTQWDVPLYRLSYLGTYRSVDFYNDSKSTIPSSTNAAIRELQERFPDRTLMLIIGGVSKGVDRTQWCRVLGAQGHRVYCFGSEAVHLAEACRQGGTQATAYDTLEHLWRALLSELPERSIVLFSPAGASFDLFKSYIERGSVFTALFTQMQHNQSC